MPYDKVSELPEEIKSKYKGSKLRQFMHVVNSMLEEGKSESAAFAGAHSAASKKEFSYDDMYEIWQRQISQENAGYNPLGGNDTQACANCNWYVARRDACAIVSGEISPTGLSDFWEEKQVYSPEPIPVIIAKESKRLSLKSIYDVITATFGFKPTSDNKEPMLSGVSFFTKEGEPTRFFLWASNNFKDNHQEIITEAAHKEFIEWCDTNQLYPEFWLWHAAGTKTGEIDWIDYVDGFLVASGTVLPEFESRIKQLQGQDIRCSHGFLGRWKSNNCLQYRSWEFSALPGWAAANPWTSYAAIKEEAEMGFSDKKREWLMQTAGVSEDQVKDWESKTTEMADSLKALGIEFKETGEEETKDSPNVNDEMIQSMIKQQQEMTSAMSTLAAEVVKLKQSDDEKIAGLITAEVSKLKEGFRPSESAETKSVERETEQITEEKEKQVAWFKELANPFTAAKTN